jgi:2',3'-cyclic-nucleotide 2'-phosphodiesterase
VGGWGKYAFRSLDWSSGIRALLWLGRESSQSRRRAQSRSRGHDAGQIDPFGADAGGNFGFRRCRVWHTLAAVNILFIGDVVGEPGRRAVRRLLPGLRRALAVDVVIANGENSAGGSGITVATANELFDAGVDALTSGDHLWDQKEVMILMSGEPRFIRPLNYPVGTPGQGSALISVPGHPPVGVLNLQGRTFMAALENPFLVGLAEIEKLRESTPVIFVDFHAEATSEKIAFGRMVDGKVSAVVGTHTHVQTADEQVFPGGTAYLSDAGFTGPHESVLGREIEPVIRRFTTLQPQRFEVAKGRVMLQGALVEIEDANGRARAIRRVSELLPASEGRA